MNSVERLIATIPATAKANGRARLVLLFGVLGLLILANVSTVAYAQITPPGAGPGARQPSVVPGVVWVRFAEGHRPQTGASTAGLASFDAAAAPFQIVQIRQAFPELERYAARHGRTATTEWLLSVYEVSFSALASPGQVAEALAQSPDVAMAEAQPMYELQAIPKRASPDDTYYSSSQANLRQMKLEGAWDVTKGDSGDVVIAIVDNGVEISHEDLSPTLWTNPGETADNLVDDDGNGYVDDIHGWNFRSNVANPTPSSNAEYHGTQVAGTANAATDNTKGIAGAAWNAETMGIHAGCRNNAHSVCYSAKGIIYAYTNDADIINLSFGQDYYSAVEHNAVKAAFEAGSLVIAGAGNDGENFDDNPFYPAAYPEVLAVGAVNYSSDKVASFSNYGRSVSVFAPGDDMIATTVSNAYLTVGGTSFSSPSVAGVAALVKTKNSSWDPERIREHLRITSDNIDAANSSNLAGLLGSGRVNAHQALTATEKPAIRLLSTTVVDANGDGVFSVNEKIKILATFVNYGADASSISIGFSGTDSYMTWETSSVNAGSVDHGDKFTGTYTFTIKSAPPAGHTKRLYTSISEGTFKDSPDFFDLKFSSDAYYATHETPTIKVSFFGTGNLGTRTIAGFDEDLGEGFQVKQSGGTWEDYLNEGALIVGTSSSKVMSSARGAPTSTQEQDFAPLSGFHPLLNDPGIVGSQDGSVSMGPSASSTANLSLQVIQNTSTWNASDKDDVLLLRYHISNTSTTPLDNLYIGLFLDWDLDGGSDNVALFSTPRRLGYIADDASSGSRFVGVRNLSWGGDWGYAALDNDSQPLGTSFTDAEKYALLSGGIGTRRRGSGDVAQFISLGLNTLGGLTASEVVFGIVTGTDSTSLFNNADALTKEFFGGAITLSTNTTTVAEDAGATTIEVTATASNTMRRTQRLPISVWGSGAAGAVDFGSVTDFELTLPSGQTSAKASFTLTPTNDTADESDEIITIGTTSNVVTMFTSLTLTDDDATPSISLSVSPTSVDEGDGATTVTVTGTLSGSTTFGAAQSIPLTITGSGNAGVVGFTPVTGVTLPIAAGATSGTTTFTLTPTDNTADESDETITIGSSSALVTQTASLTLTDDDGSPSVALSLSATTIDESDGDTTITITGTLSGSNTFAAAQSIPLTVAGSGGSGVVGFTPVTGVTLPIAAGATSGATTFTLSPTDNQTDESDETITISSTSALVSNSVTITLTDDDAAASISLSTNPTSVKEGDGATTVTVTATSTGTFAGAQTLPIKVAGSGTDGAVDFAAVSDFNLTLAANATSGTATFTLTPTDDKVDESDETITISSTHASVTQSATITLTDDDDTPSIALSVSPTSVSESDGDTTITVTGTLSGGTTFGAAQSIALSVAGSGNSNVVGFSPVTGVTLAVAAGATSGKTTFTLTPTDDQTDESDETITISSTSALVTQSASLTLTDDDATPSITLSLSATTIDESDGDTTITITGTLSGSTTFGVAQSIPITVAGSGNSGVVGFSPVTGVTLPIAAGGTSGKTTFTLSPTDNQTDESDETITISSTSALISNSVTITLTDDDGAATIRLSVNPTSVTEGGGAKTVTVTATSSGTFADAQTLPIKVAGSGTDGAVDFAAVSDFNLTLAANATSGTATFTLTPTDDKVDESDETITISSSHSSVTQSATITLTDDDATPSIALSLSATTIDESDGDTTITITGTLSGGTTFGAAQSIALSVAGSGNSNVVGFSPVTGVTLPVAVGATSGKTTFTLTPTDDQTDESDETITISSTSALISNSVTITLTDDDGAATIRLSVNPASVTEGGGAKTVTVTATSSGTFADAQTLPIKVAGSGTDGAVDFAAVSDFNLTLAANATSGTATFTLTPTDDKVDESDETITISSTHASVTQSATITLTDDDATPSIALSLSATTIDESDGDTTITITGTLSGGTTFGAAQSIALSVAGSGNPNVVGFSPVTGVTLPVAVGATSGKTTFTLTPTDDQTDESDETITISSTSALISNSVTITLTDDDGAATIRLSVNPTTLTEGGGAKTVTVTATSNGTFADAQTLPIKVAGSGTDGAVDFAAVSDFNLTLAANATSGTATFTLTPTDDKVDESDETITISSTHASVTQSATITLTDDDATPSIALSLSATTIAESDGDTTITITGTLSGGTTFGAAQSITLSVAGSGGANVVGFSPVTGVSLPVAVGATSGKTTFTLTPTDDQTDESDETITISSTSALISNSVTITLTDDDGAATIRLSVNPTSVTEGGGAKTVTVTATSSGTFAAAQVLPIKVTGSGTDGAVDFAAVSDFNLTLAANATSGTATFTLTPTDDKVDESDETVTVSSTHASVTQSATITLTDDDATPSITLSVSPSSVSEGGGGTVVTVTGAVTGGTTFGAAQSLALSVTGSGNASVVGFSPVTGVLLPVAAEGTSGKTTFTITPTDNTVDESDETITIGSSSALVTQSAALTLTDDDDTPSIALSVSPTSVDEGSGATIITVTGTVGGGTTFGAAQSIALSVAGSGNAGVVGFAPVTGVALPVAAQATSGTTTFTLTPTDNQTDEGDETITISSTSDLVSNSVTLTLHDNDGAATIRLAASPTSVAEGDGATTVTVTATSSGTFSGAQVLPISVAGSGTGGAVDFAAVADFNLTLTAGATTGSATFTLTPTDDLEDEVDEVLTISSSHASVTQSATLALTDDDARPSIALSVAPSTVGEGDGATTITVTGTVSGGTTYGTAQSVGLTVAGSGNSGVVQFAPVTGVTLPVAAGAASGTTTFTLAPTDNQTVDADETVTVSSSSPLVTGSATVTLQDDDGGVAISLSVSPASVSEGAGATVVTVTATTSDTFTDAQVLPITVAGSGAAGAVDFAPVADFDLTLAAGAATGTATFTVTPTDDEVDEADETITIGSSHALVTQSGALELTDDDATPTITIEVSPDFVNEGDGDVPITVTGTLDGNTTFGTAQSVALTIAGSGDPGVVGFAQVTGVALPIAALETSGETIFTLTPIDNESEDADETITISGPGALVSNAVTISLTDNDGPAAISLSVSPTSVSEGDGATAVSVTATSNRTLTDAETVPIAVVGSGVDHAVDFTPLADFSLTIAEGTTTSTETLTVAPTDDQVDEADETITFSSSHALVTQAATLTLTDDDATPSITLSVEPTTIGEGDGATTVTVTGTVAGGTTFGAEQSIAIAVAGSGSTDVVEFDPVTGVSLLVAAEATAAFTTFTLTPTDDQVDQADETVTISSPSALVSNSVTIFLRDDDGATTIRLNASPQTVGEEDGATSVSVTATSSAAFADTQVLPIAVAGSGALEAVDFAAVSGFDLTLLAGETTTSGTFTLTPTDDFVDEVHESLQITSTHASVVDSAFVTLTDDDRAPEGVMLSVTPTVVNEDDGATSIAVMATVSGNTRYAVEKVMNLSVTGSGLPNPVDFVAVPDFSLSIPAEAASGTGGFVLSPENDEEGESDETITIRSDSTFVLTEAILVLRDDDGGITRTDPAEEMSPSGVAPPYPNPTAGRVTFVVSLSAPADRASLRLFNALGQQVAVPFDGAMGAGEHTVHFDGQRLSAGVYMYVFVSQGTRLSGYLVMAQ